jgi:hypothetical protein
VAVNASTKRKSSAKKTRNGLEQEGNQQQSENIMDSRGFETRPAVNNTLEKRKLVATSKVVAANNWCQVAEENKEAKVVTSFHINVNPSLAPSNL